MRYLQYKGVVEREYKMSLKKVMYQLCVTENLNSVEGAKKLGIAKEIFVSWRRYFRLEDRQILFDQTVEGLMQLKNLYPEESANFDARQTVASAPANTLEDLEDAVDGLITYYKHIHYTSEGLSLKTAKLPLYKFGKAMVADYRRGELVKELQAES
ncbi:hypothetical protein [Planococcus sp. CAU13]|uniref:hypothetical protein n=1 Tax=Planococcus sp. CAU13 TaxID=1541197 RepID=UPI00052FF668|nr:hypothetical protein [Planococcus sp. CAU13]